MHIFRLLGISSSLLIGSIVTVLGELSPVNLRGLLYTSRERRQQQVDNEMTTTSFEVIDDTFVRDSNPNRNYNDVTNLGVAFGPNYNERITFLKFPIDPDLTRSNNTTDPTTFFSAVVRMRVNQATSGNNTLNLFLCDSLTWDESLITWNDRPTYDNVSAAPLATRTVTPADSQTWLEFDVTTAFLAAVQAGQSVLSLVIEPERPMDGDSIASELTRFDSKEDLVNIPILSVTHMISNQPNHNTSLTIVPTQIPTASPIVSSTPSDIPTSNPEYPLVSLTADGTLAYTKYSNEINDALGSTANAEAVNTVPDFSNVGYMGGGVPIPFVQVRQTVGLCLCLVSEKSIHPSHHLLECNILSWMQ